MSQPSRNKSIKSRSKKNKKSVEKENSVLKSPSSENSSLTSPIKEIVSPKVNVFQFMMDSRHKVIGSNSPGKEKKPEENKNFEETSKEKGKRKKRKEKFEDWAEKKGRSKRKLEDEAQELHIKKTLKKRAKRLKRMLDIIDETLKNTSNDASESDDDIFTNTSINLRIIETDTESSNDFKESKQNIQKMSNEVEKVESTTSVSKRKDNKKKSNDIQNTKFKKIKPLEDNKNTNINVSNNEENDFENSILESDNLNDNVETENTEIIAPEINNIDKQLNDISSEDNLLKNNITSTPTTFSVKKNNKFVLSLKQKKDETENNKSPELNEDIFPASSIPLKSTPVTRSKQRQTKLINNSGSKPKNDVFSPKTWRMKVRLFEKENVDTESKNNNSPDENIIVIDDLNNDDIKTTPKIVQGKISNFFTLTPSSNSVLNNTKENKQVKIAPLFLKKLKKSKANAEAKRNFLHSGMPYQMKKILTKPQMLPEIDFSFFPKISHIQQKCTNDLFWNLPYIPLPLRNTQLEANIIINNLKIGLFTNCKTTKNVIKKGKVFHESSTKITDLKNLITKLKEEYSYFPVYKIFRLYYQKFLKNSYAERTDPQIKSTEKTNSAKKRKRGRQKKSVEKPVEEVQNKRVEYQMWTEKYKPSCQDDIIGNYKAVKELKSWLEAWVNYSENQKSFKKRKRLNSNSSDDFCTDSDTRSTASLPQEMMILFGSYGVGKTSTVYALCNELNINVIEINASSKRTGKKILTELLEATQSHQVKNADSKSTNNFFQKKVDVTNDKIDEDINKKMSLLLMEDVDIVFEDQDDGFISSLTTLVTLSKRPIILTSSDRNCLHLQKLFAQYTVIEFYPLSARVITPWLQILCLIEGVYAKKDLIDRLLVWNKSDIRKTLLQLQFCVQTGGDPLTNCVENKEIIDNISSTECISPCDQDDNSNLSWFQEPGNVISNITIIHNCCVDVFTPYYEKDNEDFQCLYPVNLGILWWNVPHIFGIKPLLHQNIFKNEDNNSTEKNNGNENDNNLNIIDNRKIEEINTDSNTSLESAIEFLESAIFIDVMQTKLKSENNCCEPAYNYWETSPVNSLILDENYDTYDHVKITSQEISQWLIESSTKRCIKSCDSSVFDKDFNLNVAGPNADEIRWRSKHHKSMTEMLQVIPAQIILDRTAICQDYFSSLRFISRLENSRFANNNKRKSRFYHYFKTFNIHLSNESRMILCNTLATNND